MKTILSKNVPAFFVSVVVIMITILLWKDAGNTEYKYLFMLPLFHGILMLIFFPWAEDMLKYPAQQIIYVLFFIRNVVTPLLLSFNNYNVGIIIRNRSDINLAIFLMLYETFAVFVVLSRKFAIYKRFKSDYRIPFLERCAFVQKPFNLLLLIITMTTLLLWISLPELRQSYESLFNLTNLVKIVNVINKDDLNTTTRALSTGGSMLIMFCRFFVSLWILYKIRMRSNSTFIGIITALVISLIQMLFIGAQLMLAFYILFFILFVTIKLWPRSRSFMIAFGGTVIGIGIIWVSFVKGGFTTWDSFAKELGSSLQAYLPGVTNVAGTVSIERKNILNTMFADIYTMIPFRNSLIGLQVENLSDQFNNHNNVAGQILPLIGESYHYFGIIFAPILSMLFARGAIWANERMYKAKNIFAYGTYTMFMLYLSSMLVCKNFILFGSTFTSTLLPMVIMCKFVGDEYDFDNFNESIEGAMNVE